jgi:hypothetical protein
LEIDPTTLHNGKHDTTDRQREKDKKRLMDLYKWSSLSLFSPAAMALMLFWLRNLPSGLKE